MFPGRIKDEVQCRPRRNAAGCDPQQLLCLGTTAPQAKPVKPAAKFGHGLTMGIYPMSTAIAVFGNIPQIAVADRIVKVNLTAESAVSLPEDIASKLTEASTQAPQVS